MSRSFTIVLIFIAYMSTVHSSLAQWSSDSTVNTPICTTAGEQLYPTIASDGSGGFVIVWGDARNGTSGYDIYAQRINAYGVVQWMANGVAICTTGTNQPHPKLIADGNGGAIIAWGDARTGLGNYDIYAQRINASGVVQWDTNGVPVCTATNYQLNPKLVSDGSGGAIITWDDARAFSNSDIYAQRINSSGIAQWTTDGVAISSALGDQSIPAMVSDGSGGAIITWYDSRVSSATDIYAQRVNSSGVVQWTANGVTVCTASGRQDFPVVAGDGSGGAIISWQDQRNGSTNIDIYAQRVDSSGTTQWTTDGVVICAAGENQLGPQIVTDASGGALITWWTDHVSDDDVFAQHVNASGAVQWAANGVAVSAGSGDRNLPMITSDGSGGAIIAWNDGRFTFNHIFAQRVSASGVGEWITNGVDIAASGYSLIQGIVSYAGGGAVVAFQDFRNNVDNDIYAQQVNGSGQLGVITGVKTLAGTMPDAFALNQNYPNPFNPSTTIEYELPTQTNVTLKVFDVLGREVATLVNNVEQAGYKTVNFNAYNLVSGVYYYRLQAGNFIETKKLVLLR